MRRTRLADRPGHQAKLDVIADRTARNATQAFQIVQGKGLFGSGRRVDVIHDSDFSSLTGTKQRVQGAR